ncbi:large ribosomal subunit protein mL51-like [Littorina saxatilis]|uniref:Large ribosomal subunit protein mL51 n=1 Tax=Littorina saxatilis TaxID=31220 RepID=A0AAN9G3K9_9CAEN
MLTLQRAFSQLRLVVSAAAEHAVRCSNHAVTVPQMNQQMRLSKPSSQTVSRVCVQWYSTKPGSRKKDNENARKKGYETPSPYRIPGPRRYGYEPRFYTGGALPRGLDAPLKTLPSYKVKDSWNRKRALFGQNDYIDILGDGSIKPADLIRGPDWLIGFKGNELQRLKRRLMFHGERLRHLYPAKYNNIQKRIFFLYKKYNQKRGRRVTGE